MKSFRKNYIILNLITAVSVLCMMVILNSCERHNTLAVKNYHPIFITQSSAVLKASVTTNGKRTSIKCDYGNTLSYGSTKYCPSVEDLTYAFGPYYASVTLTGLSPGTTFHYRFTIVNDNGTVFGNDASFTTLNKGESGIIFNPKLDYSSVSDIEGNNYKTIQIRSQVWMAENLKTTMFNDAMPISKVKEWAHLTKSAYCWYDDDSASYKLSNGALYNWYSVNTGKLCPTGWHVPSNLEWATLINNMGGSDVTLAKLQETGTTHWSWFHNYSDATNSSGFTALPCGYRFNNEIYNDSTFFIALGEYTYFWSSSRFTDTVRYPSGAWTMLLREYNSVILSWNSIKNGLSVRCIKD
jgi:uncharacterized protein (TIGR02145 family)